MMFVLYVSLAVLIAVPVWFVWHDVYEDGIIGRAALSGIVLSATALLMQALESAPTPPVAAILLIASFAAFLAWHLFRFHRRVLRQRVMGAAASVPKDTAAFSRSGRGVGQT